MCGRFVLRASLAEIVDAFHVEEVGCTYLGGERILPGAPVMAVAVQGGVRRLSAFRWGLVPAWAKDPAVGRRLINARGESVAEKPSFREAFRRRRCLVVADGFHEGQSRDGAPKRTWLFSLLSGSPFGFAGLYEVWRDPGGTPLTTCTIVTTEPNALVAPIHNRMPVILDREGGQAWLDPRPGDRQSLEALLRPYPPEEMTCREVPFLRGLRGRAAVGNLFD
jgi:putative SOS response-associated peptidase YedK